MRDGQFFSHITALRIWGVPVPDTAQIHVSVAFPRTPPRGRGVVGHSLRRISWRVEGGLPVAEPATAWRQSSTVLGLDDLIAAADALLGGARGRDGRRAPSLCSPAELEAEVAASAGAPGIRRAVEALRHARPGVGSPAETRLRLAIVRAGLPEPVVDHPVTVRGGRVWHPDLSYPESRIAIEYEGDGHRTERARWRRDITRREVFEDAGWRVIRVTADDIRDAQVLIDRLTRLLADRAESQPERSDRVRWHDA